MNDETTYRYVFGPVPSRRLGRSLGVDLVSMKTCTFDCIYCQLGPTSCRTVTRAQYAPAADVLDDVRRRLDEGPGPDYVTLSGSGEPTLHTGLGDVLDGIHRLTDAPAAVLTNGSLLDRPEVRAACALADLVIPSLDAPNESLFERVNRPHPEITFEGLIDGLAAFRDEYDGHIWLEVFLIDGLNTTADAVEEFIPLFDKIRPDKIQLNTAVRPTAERDVSPVPANELQRIARLFGDRAEIIAGFRGGHRHNKFEIGRDDVLDMLRRRPCSVEEIARGLGISSNKALKHISTLETAGAIVSEQTDNTIYYKVAAGSNRGA